MFSHTQGKDDLRQDAVMQQVFMLVNCLLRKDKATRKRALAIRTYKVQYLMASCYTTVLKVYKFKDEVVINKKY